MFKDVQKGFNYGIYGIYGIYGLKFIHAIIWFNDFYVEDALNIFVFLIIAHVDSNI